MDGAGGVLAVAVGYLVGSFPTAPVVTRVATHGRVDIRAAGSGNPGAYNTMRTVGRAWGVLVAALDIAKGALAALAGWALFGEAGAYLGAVAGLVGHVLPVWTGFRGGKGVAVAAGAILVVFPAFFPIEAAVLAVAALVLRNAERAIWVGAATLFAGAVVWWAADLPNAWGPDPSGGLVAAVGLGMALIVGKFAATRAPS